jgi:acetyltransferase-like isoleucine patch superfamily enzyme
MSGCDVAVLGFHDGVAGQIARWFERASGCTIDCYVNEVAEPLRLDVAAENRKRVSQRTEFPGVDTFRGRPFIQSLEWLDAIRRRGVRHVLPLTPDNRTRLRQMEACLKAGLEFVSAIHESATILDEAIVHPGVWINARAVIGFKAELHPGAIVNTGAQIDHHNVMEACSQADPGVVTAGFVTLRTCAQVHTGAVIINRIEVGADAVVGAGAVVIEPVSPRSLVVGCPARVVRTW